MPITDIFIRTYKGDIEWLKYCLRSIDKFATGINNILICIPESQKEYLAPFGLTREKVITCPDYENDYIGQQISKLKAFEHSEADRIIFIDSDCVSFTEWSPQSFAVDEKPVILMTDYSQVGDAIRWKHITASFIGFTPEYEYMRRMPLMYYRSTLENLWAAMNAEGDFEAKVLAANELSEFNLIGAFAHLNEPDKYEFIDTNTYLPELRMKQFWSWGGITKDIHEEIENMLL